jgi:hypothetical protein
MRVGAGKSAELGPLPGPLLLKKNVKPVCCAWVVTGGREPGKG